VSLAPLLFNEIFQFERSRAFPRDTQEYRQGRHSYDTNYDTNPAKPGDHPFRVPLRAEPSLPFRINLKPGINFRLGARTQK
jgi:hypothetical protein